MGDIADRNRYGAITAALGAGAIMAAGVASQFDGTLSYALVAAAAILGVAALAGLYRLRYS